MKLIDLTTNEEVKPDPSNLLQIKHGVNAGQKFPVNRIVPPCEEYPEGMIKGHYRGIGWQEYVPAVFNLKIVVSINDYRKPREDSK